MKYHFFKPKTITATITSLTTLIMGTIIWSNVYAQEATDSAVENIRQAVKDKVQERLDQVVLRPVGIVGQLKQITNNSITIQTTDKSFTIDTSSTTEYQQVPGRKTLDRADLQTDSYAIIKGKIQNTDLNRIEGDTIQIIPEQEQPQRTILNGTVTKKTNSSITLDSEGTTYTITVNNSTDLYQRATEEPEEIKIADIEENDTLLVIGTPGTKQDTYTSSFVIKLVNEKSGI